MIYKYFVDLDFWFKSLLKLLYYKMSENEKELFEVLRFVLPENSGIYWDVGANHPRENSVTYPFYRIGWSGVTIEPIRNYVLMHKILRRRDSQICGVFGSNKKEQFYYFMPTQYSTTSLTRYEQMRSVGFRERKVIEVKSIQANDIFERLNPGTPGLLKIDIEGSDLTLLRSIDFTRFTPRVILVEGLIDSKYIESYLENFGFTSHKEGLMQGEIFIHSSWFKSNSVDL